MCLDCSQNPPSPCLILVGTVLPLNSPFSWHMMKPLQFMLSYTSHFFAAVSDFYLVSCLFLSLHKELQGPKRLPLLCRNPIVKSNTANTLCCETWLHESQHLTGKLHLAFLTINPWHLNISSGKNYPGGSHTSSEFEWRDAKPCLFFLLGEGLKWKLQGPSSDLKFLQFWKFGRFFFSLAVLFPLNWGQVL